MRISDWSSDVCSSDLQHHGLFVGALLGKVEIETDVLAGETAMSPGILCKQVLDADTHHLGSMQVQRAPSRRGSQRLRVGGIHERTRLPACRTNENSQASGAGANQCQ